MSTRLYLPKYRGGAPIHYALINGDEEAGLQLWKWSRKWMPET